MGCVIAALPTPKVNVRHADASPALDRDLASTRTTPVVGTPNEAAVPEPAVATTAGWSSTVPASLRRHSKSATPEAVNVQAISAAGLVGYQV
jgi:hypothetical protein